MVITIIVMLILVAVTISIAVNGGLFDYAGRAAKETGEAKDIETGLTNFRTNMSTEELIEKFTTRTVTNPYQSETPSYTWTCKNGLWRSGTVSGADIIARIYVKGTTTPEGFGTGTAFHNEPDIGDPADEVHTWRTLTDIKNYITKVIICDGITSIPYLSFSECISLTDVTISDTVTTIGANSFANCTSLTEVTIPDTVTTIQSNAFYGVQHIKYNGPATGSPWGASSIN